MTACQERVKTWNGYDSMNNLEDTINKFLKTNVSKVIDLNVYSLNGHLELNESEVYHYAYIRYIPI